LRRGREQSTSSLLSWSPRTGCSLRAQQEPQKPPRTECDARSRRVEPGQPKALLDEPDSGDLCHRAWPARQPSARGRQWDQADSKSGAKQREETTWTLTYDIRANYSNHTSQTFSVTYSENVGCFEEAFLVSPNNREIPYTIATGLMNQGGRCMHLPLLYVARRQAFELTWGPC
jgi:hypothetical protein